MLSIFLIGLALSMDAFSISLSIGLNNISKLKITLIPIVVGLMHFIMPFLGVFLGNQILNIFNFNAKLIISIILFYLALMMFLDRNKEEKNIISSYISIFLLAFSVSIDSFSVGLGLSGLTDKFYLSFIIFSLCSACITYIGLLIGKYSVKFLKRKALYLGIAILLIISIVNLCQILF